MLYEHETAGRSKEEISPLYLFEIAYETLCISPQYMGDVNRSESPAEGESTKTVKEMD